jgi:hypothetical protein
MQRLTEEEKARLGELMIAIAKVKFRGMLPVLAHVVAERYLPKYAVYYNGLVCDMLLHGPGSFREQAEARLAKIGGEKFAAFMCGMNDRK